MPARPVEQSATSCDKLRPTRDRRNNTGHHGISLQKVANTRDDKRHYITVLVTTMIGGLQLRRQFSIERYGLEKAMRLAIRQLCRWHHMTVSDEVLDTIDLSKARAWLMEELPKKSISTNTGFEAVRIVYKNGYWYVVSTWLDPKTKEQRAKYASLRKYTYIDALRIAIAARCLALGGPIKEVTGADAQKGSAWLDEHMTKLSHGSAIMDKKA